MLKIALFGFALATLALAYLIFVGSIAWSLSGFDCPGTYWECHRSVAREMALYVGLPVVGWAIYAVLLIRAWKKL